MKDTKWSKTDVEYLKSNFSTTKDDDLAKFFLRSPNAVRIRAHRLGVKKVSVLYRMKLRLTEIEKQVIIGSLLGDLSCRTNKTSKNPRLEGGHGSKQREYMLWKVVLLKRLLWRVRRTKENTYSYQSKSFPALKKYCKLFYPNGKKVLTRESLDLLEDFGLLIWYFDDGSYSLRDKSCSIYTNGFSLKEQYVAVDWFMEKYGILARLHRAQDPKNYPDREWYYLHFPRVETKKLFKIFRKFDIPECMKYKLGKKPSFSTNLHTTKENFLQCEVVETNAKAMEVQ